MQLPPPPPRPERRPYLDSYVRQAAEKGESAESALAAFDNDERAWVKQSQGRYRRLDQ